jgi:hypothetical protein
MVRLFGGEEAVEGIEVSATTRGTHDFVRANSAPELDGRIGGEIFEANWVDAVSGGNAVVAG